MTKANARLIAQAPRLKQDNQQLLEACREAVDFLEYLDAYDYLREKLTKAIAAAEAGDR
jgi:hypothetical protein